MILRTTTGKSFKGVGQYVLHDKGAKSADRVAFVETLNAASDRADVALAHMIDVAKHQRDLKRANGKRGTQNSKPVYHLTLSWDTSEQPTKADQIEAAKEALKSLGLQDRQALLVAHNDTENPHIHAVVNLVCPRTGDTAKLGNDRVKLSEWALEYRRERGQEHLCPQRKRNQEKRLGGEFVKSQNMTRREHYEWKKARTASLWDEHRAETANLRGERKAQFDALWQQKEERFDKRRAEIKALWKPTWRDVFKDQRKALRDYDRSLMVRLQHARRLQGSSVINMFRAMVGDKAQRQAFIDSQTAERQQIAQRQTQEIRDAGKEITKAWKYDRDLLRESHKAQNQDRYKQTQEKSKDIWQQVSRHEDRKEIKTARQFAEAKDRRKPENETHRHSLESFFGGDQEAIDRAREQQEKQRDRNKHRKRNRPRDRGKGRERGM